MTTSADTFPPAAPPVGRRERKTLAIKRALEECAMRLFEERGYDATTVEDITEAADVAPRTFFRHFQSKDEVVMSGHDERLALFQRALADRPAHEELPVAVRAAVHALVDSALIDDRARFRWRLSRDTPAMLARVLERQAAAEAPLAATIADRLGDPPSALRSAVLAAALLTAFRVAIHRWCGDEDADLETILTEAVAVLDHSLQG